MFKDESKVEAITAFGRDERAKGGVDGWSTVSNVHFSHFEERVEDERGENRRVRGNKRVAIYSV